MIKKMFVGVKIESICIQYTRLGCDFIYHVSLFAEIWKQPNFLKVCAPRNNSNE